MNITGNIIVDLLILVACAGLLGGRFAFTIELDSEDNSNRGFWVLLLFVTPILAAVSAYFASFIYPNFGKIAYLSMIGALFYANFLIDAHAGKTKFIDKYIAVITIISFVMPIVVLISTMFFNLYFIKNNAFEVHKLRAELNQLNQEILKKNKSLKSLSLQYEDQERNTQELNELLELKKEKFEALLNQLDRANNSGFAWITNFLLGVVTGLISNAIYDRRKFFSIAWLRNNQNK